MFYKSRGEGVNVLQVQRRGTACECFTSLNGGVGMFYKSRGRVGNVLQSAKDGV